MNSRTLELRKLIAEFLANIGVAWFAAGVIGIFVNKINDPVEVMKSLSWGLISSIIFLYFGTVIIKGKTKK